MIHSFEHVTNPLETLLQVKERLSPKGIFIMALPVVDSYEYERYKKNWTGCDAPVHVVMYTTKGLECLFEKAGLEIVNIYNLENDFFLRMSEMTERGYSLDKINSQNILNELGEKKLEELQETMKKINRERRSGLVTIVIKTHNRR
jgi:hypothetical protein